MHMRWRSMAVVVLLFTALAVAMVWGLSLQLQAQLREQMLQQAEARALQLADAMGGQLQAYVQLSDQALGRLRERWPTSPGSDAHWTQPMLDGLPPGLVSHVTVVDADGTEVFNSLGSPLQEQVNGQFVWGALMYGGDQLEIGVPVLSVHNARPMFVLGRPILHDERFDGAVLLWVSTEVLAQLLGRQALTEDDVVALVHPDGRFLARSRDNALAMTQTLPIDRPYLANRSAMSGVYLQQGLVDTVTRLYGWQRIMPTGTVLLVGLAESGVLKPLEGAQRQATLLTALLSLALAGIGFWIGWLQWRLERGQGEMRQSRHRLQEAQQMAHLGHWTFDARTGQMHWSDEMYRICGQDPAVFRPDFDAYWRQVSPDERKRLRKAFDAALADRIDLDDVHRIVRPDGTERFVRLICQSAPQGQGRTYRGTLQDMTELRQAQLALERVNNGLEQRVKVRTRELQALNSDLESFTYSVSHDLRTPLRSIHGFATLLQESEAEHLSDEGKDFLRRIQESSRRMGVLITDLLSMARHSRADMHPEWVDLSALAQQVVAELERGEPQRDVRWEIEPGLRVQADPTLIRVVLQNLLGNAWKYTGQTAQAHIRLHGTGVSEDRQIGFCVSDNGAGFDMAYGDQLFQPFKRLHAHHQFEGTGIGLATVARVVQRHGGRVRGEGVVGQGASFCFSLPLEPVRQFGDSTPTVPPRR